MATPPPLPPPQDLQQPLEPLPYASVGPNRPADNGAPDGAQKIFDTVTGPNVRLKDNLIQLACVIAGAAIGGGVGYGMGDGTGMAVGIVAGLVGALLLSGAVIGIVRLAGATKK